MNTTSLLIKCQLINNNMNITFQQYLLEQEKYDYFKAIQLLENELNESIFDKLSTGIKNKIEFIKTLAKSVKQDVSKIIPLLKNKQIFKFFAKVKFSLSKLFNILKKGYKLYSKLEKIIADYVADSKVVKWTQNELSKLDSFLSEHPMLKRFSGLIVAGLLVYIWLNMSFTPDFTYSMDFTDIILALGGTFSLSDIFAGPEGVKLLTYFATGALLGLSFPWPGPTSVHFVGGVLYSLAKQFKIKFQKPKGL